MGGGGAGGGGGESRAGCLFQTLLGQPAMTSQRFESAWDDWPWAGLRGGGGTKGREGERNGQPKQGREGKESSLWTEESKGRFRPSSLHRGKDLDSHL